MFCFPLQSTCLEEENRRSADTNEAAVQEDEDVVEVVEAISLNKLAAHPLLSLKSPLGKRLLWNMPYDTQSKQLPSICALLQTIVGSPDHQNAPDLAAHDMVRNAHRVLNILKVLDVRQVLAADLEAHVALEALKSNEVIMTRLACELMIDTPEPEV
jgi:hypothetical protein